MRALDRLGALDERVLGRKRIWIRRYLLAAGALGAMANAWFALDAGRPVRVALWLVLAGALGGWLYRDRPRGR